MKMNDVLQNLYYNNVTLWKFNRYGVLYKHIELNEHPCTDLTLQHVCRQAQLPKRPLSLLWRRCFNLRIARIAKFLMTMSQCQLLIKNWIYANIYARNAAVARLTVPIKYSLSYYNILYDLILYKSTIWFFII